MISPHPSGGLRRLAFWAGVAVFVACISLHLATRASWLIMGTTPQRQVEPRAYSNVPGDLEPRLDIVSREIPDLPYSVSINARGFRTAGATHAAGSGKPLRVLCLGDSFTYGVGVGDEQTFPALLQAYLETRFPDRQVEVINAGVPFYDIFDELSYYRDKGRHLAADVVVLQFYINDLEAMSGSFFRQDLKIRQGGVYNASEQALGCEVVEHHINAWVGQRFPGLKALSQAALPTPGPSPASTGPFRAFHFQATEAEKGLLGNRSALLHAASLPAMARFWTNYRQALAILHDAVRRDGAAFLFVLAPDLAQVREDRNAPAAALVPFCREKHIPLLDLSRTLRRMADGKPERFFLIPKNEHPNAVGNTVLAKTVAEALETGPGADMIRMVERAGELPFAYQNPVSLPLILGAQGILPLTRGGVSATPVRFSGLDFFSLALRTGNRIDGLRPDLIHGQTGELVVRLDAAMPLDQVSVTLFRRLFSPANGYLELAWSRDGNVYTQLQFASDKDIQETEGFETSRLSEIDLRGEPVRQLYLRLRLHNQAWVFTESIKPQWRRFEIVCYPSESAQQASETN